MGFGTAQTYSSQTFALPRPGQLEATARALRSTALALHDGELEDLLVGCLAGKLQICASQNLRHVIMSGTCSVLCLWCFRLRLFNVVLRDNLVRQCERIWALPGRSPRSSFGKTKQTTRPNDSLPVYLHVFYIVVNLQRDPAGQGGCGVRQAMTTFPAGYSAIHNVDHRNDLLSSPTLKWTHHACTGSDGTRARDQGELLSLEKRSCTLA